MRIARAARIVMTAGVLAAAFGTSLARAQDAPPVTGGPQLEFQHGPITAALASRATIIVPKGYSFLDGAETRKLMTALQNPTSGQELGTIMPDEGDWLMVFEFSPVGYVSDDEKDELDADAILDSIRAGTEQSNDERRRNGWPTMAIEGWEHLPGYDPTTQNLQWAVRASSEGQPIVNYNTRLLGRYGVMEVTLVQTPDKLDATLPAYRQLLAGFEYIPGSKYGEFSSGDKIAEYGLTALVAGGGLAVAAKTGLLAKLGLFLAKAWKLVVVAFLAVGAFIKRIFTGRKRETV